MTSPSYSEVRVDDPDLDLDAGTYTLRWREDGQARNALLFLGHTLHSVGDPRGMPLLVAAREAGGLARPVDMDDLVDVDYV